MKRIFTVILIVAQLLILSTISSAQTFTRMTTGVFAEEFGCSLGSSWGDVDNDGYEDLIIVNGVLQPTDRMFFYKNNGDGTFSRLEANPVADYRGATIAASWGDCDSDGDVDLHVSTFSGSGNISNLLFINEGNGIFSQITEDNACVEEFSSSGNFWIDFDNDGDLDLFVIPWVQEPNRLYINDGFGNFQRFNAVGLNEVTNEAPIGCCSDFDNDNDLDIFVGDVLGSSKLIINNGNSTFSAATNCEISIEQQYTLSASWGDYDNDSWSDLIVTNIYPEKDYSTFGNNFLYHNKGDMTFETVDAGEMSTEHEYSSGSAWGDFDNDGDLDLIITNNSIIGIANNSYFRNDGDGSFTKITSSTFAEDCGESCSTCDFDNDGDLDILVVNQKASGGTWQPMQNILYVNDGNENNWIQIKCMGTVSNTTAIGAKVKVKATINGNPTWQMREIAQQTGAFGHNSLRIHFGLGDAALIDSIKIYWPSGMVQTMADVNAKQILTIAEPIPNQQDIRMMFSSERSLKHIVFTKYLPWTVIRNIGSSHQADISVSCRIDTSGIVVYSEDQTIESLNSLELKRINFSEVIFDAPGSYKASYRSLLTGDEDESNDSLGIAIQAVNIVDDFELGAKNWTSNDRWGTTYQFAFSGEKSLNESPDSKYENNADIWIEYNDSFDLSRIGAAYLVFYTKHFIEQDKDFGFLEISSDGGANWNQIGDVFTGMLFDWEEVKLDLTPYCGNNGEDVRIRFHFLSDSTTNLPGWFIDDISIFEGSIATTIQNNELGRTVKEFKLFNSYPNPFNAQTVISYQLPKASHVKLSVYNVLGQKIKTITDRKLDAGQHQEIWDGTDNFGRLVPSGLYVYRLEAEGFISSEKMLLLK